MFATGARIDPYDAAGLPHTHGTHRQLGLPSCMLLATVGVPCPSCGMTTSVSLMMHGDPAAALRANWAGVFVASGGLMATGWLALLACGLSRRRLFSAENTILCLAVSGAFVTILRYLGLAGSALVSNLS